MAGAYWDVAWNPVAGCTPVSAGCEHCWAAAMASRFHPELAHDGRWLTGPQLYPERLATPLHWRKPRRVFVANMSDLFHEAVPDEFIAAVFGIMAATPQHAYLVLTKRPRRMTQWFVQMAEYRIPAKPWSAVEEAGGTIRQLRASPGPRRTSGSAPRPRTRTRLTSKCRTCSPRRPRTDG